MKKIVPLILLACLCTGNTDSQPKAATPYLPILPTVQVQANDSVHIPTLIQKARWGSGEAYIQLAICYKEGKGVQQDLFGFFYMMIMAKEHGVSEEVKEYLAALPKDDEFKYLYEVLNYSRSEMQEQANNINARIAKMKCRDAQHVKALLNILQGETELDNPDLDKAIEAGSQLALIAKASLELHAVNASVIQKWEAMTDKFPIVHMIIANALRKSEKPAEHIKQIAHHYIQAEKLALLDRVGANYLLHYHENGGSVQLSKQDVKRLKAFLGRSEE